MVADEKVKDAGMLNGHDFCDATKGQIELAMVRLQRMTDDDTDEEILLCAHHFGKHEVRLTLDGWLIVEDIRGTLLVDKTREIINESP